jgi:tetratricopeptide (TPR) repeat protein
MVDAQKAIKLDPAVPLNYVNRGNVFYYRGDPEKALEDYHRTISMKPEYPPDESKAHYGIGRIFEERGDMETAFKEYDQAVHFHDVARNYMSRAQAHRKLGRNKEGRNDYLEALKQKPTKASLLTAIGETWFNDDNSEKALEYYNKAIEADPDFTKDPEFRNHDGTAPSGFTFPYTNRGVIYLEKGLYREAVADFNKSIELKDDNPIDYFQRALAYWNLGEMEKARSDAKKYLSLEKKQPRQENPTEKLEKQGTIQMILGNNSRAASILKKAEEETPDEFNSYLIRGIVLYESGNIKAARKDLEKVVKLGIPVEKEKARKYLNKIANQNNIKEK